jgi:hypothetical protein
VSLSASAKFREAIVSAALRLAEDARQQAFGLYPSGRADGLLIYNPDFLHAGVEFLVKSHVPVVVLESIRRSICREFWP